MNAPTISVSGKVGDDRLFGAVAALWLLFLILLSVISVAMTHPDIQLHDFFPSRSPDSWIVPGLVIIPPLMMIAALNASQRISKFLLWLAIILLALPVLSIILLFAAAAIFSGY